MNRKPPELHIVDGTKPKNGKAGSLIPETIRKRIPPAEWLENPANFKKTTFVTETAEFLFQVYGIGCDQDKHTLSMLADQISIFCQCSLAIESEGLISEYNNGQTKAANPHLQIKQKTLSLILQLMNELGLTPRTRLAAGKGDGDDEAEQLLRGPLG
jgi:P27 family predicted phage terminase small subunit